DPPAEPAAPPAGSLLAAARAVLAAAPDTSGPAFATLRSGLGALPGAVARAAGVRLRLGLPVRRIEQTAAGFRIVAGPVPAPIATTPTSSRWSPRSCRCSPGSTCRRSPPG